MCLDQPHDSVQYKFKKTTVNTLWASMVIEYLDIQRNLAQVDIMDRKKYRPLVREQNFLIRFYFSLQQSVPTVRLIELPAKYHVLFRERFLCILNQPVKESLYV